MRFLLENGADPNAQASGIYDLRSPLHYAVAGKELPLAHSLLEFGANPRLADSEGLTPIGMAHLAAAEHNNRLNRDMLAILKSY